MSGRRRKLGTWLGAHRPWLWLGLVLASLASLVAVLAVAGSQGPPISGDRVPDEILVKFQPGADPAKVAARHGARVKSVIPSIEVHVLAVPPGSVDAKVAEFQADPEVEFAEPNGMMQVAPGP